MPSIARACAARDTKLVTLSRAGYGGSTRLHGRSIVDAVDDVQALLEHLGVQSVAVGGHSGGGEFLSFLLCFRPIKGTHGFSGGRCSGHDGNAVMNGFSS
jgi:pimeloyl-ACP methyl ester carboxylesterase